MSTGTYLRLSTPYDLVSAVGDSVHLTAIQPNTWELLAVKNATPSPFKHSLRRGGISHIRTLLRMLMCVRYKAVLLVLGRGNINMELGKANIAETWLIRMSQMAPSRTLPAIVLGLIAKS